MSKSKAYMRSEVKRLCWRAVVDSNLSSSFVVQNEASRAARVEVRSVKWEMGGWAKLEHRDHVPSLSEQ